MRCGVMSSRPPDARQLQKLRRAEGAARHDHLAPGADLLHPPPAPDLNPRRPAPLQQDPLGPGAGQHRQICALAHHRMQIGGGGRAALSIAGRIVELGHLEETDPLIVAGVEIGPLA